MREARNVLSSRPQEIMYFDFLRQDIHTLKSGEKLSADVEIESEDSAETDLV